MGILDMVTSVAGEFGGANTAKIGTGLMQEIGNTPGGVSGIFESFQQNGLGALVQQWSSGQSQSATPDQIQQGLGNTGIIERIAERTGLSPGVIKVGLAVLVPLVIHHFVSSGHVTPEGQPTDVPAGESGSVLQSVLGKLL